VSPWRLLRLGLRQVEIAQKEAPTDPSSQKPVLLFSDSRSRSVENKTLFRPSAISADFSRMCDSVSGSRRLLEFQHKSTTNGTSTQIDDDLIYECSRLESLRPFRNMSRRSARSLQIATVSIYCPYDSRTFRVFEDGESRSRKAGIHSRICWASSRPMTEASRSDCRA
jgi:hypothetical protein